MVTSKQIKEKFRDSKRSFTHNWNLFKENKVGLLGLGIMVAFILVAATSPFMGLKHPIDWFAPDEDVVQVENWLDQSTDGIVTASIVERIVPNSNFKTVDRIYLAGGEKDSVTAPYGLYAKSSSDGSKAWVTWSGAYETNSMISSNVEGMNFGAKRNSNEMDFRLIFGTESGTLFLIHDELNAQYPPSGSDVRVANLDGPVVGVDAHEEVNRLLDGNDIFVASTESGTLYIFDGYFNEQVRITIANTTLTRPSISNDGLYVYVGSTDGKIYGFSTNDGLPIGDVYDLYDATYDYTSSDGDAPDVDAANARRDYWSSYPLTAEGKVFASTDDGRIHILNADDMTPLLGWEGGYKVDQTLADLDFGNLTTPYVRPDGNEILVGSSSGFAYRIDASPREDTSISAVRLVFDTSINNALTTSIVAPPYYDALYSRLIFITARNHNDTMSDPTDDSTLIYGIDTTGEVKWRKTLQGVAYNMPVVYDDYALGSAQHSGEGEVVLTTVQLDANGEPISGEASRIYSYRCTGTMIAPLPPTWTMNEDELPVSGIKYPLGTDAQGRDILSQVLLGSRIALLVGFSAAIFSISIGMLVGLVSGYYGGNVDIILMRFTDVILTLPGLPLLIILAALMEPSVWNIVFIIGIVGWGGTARVIRSEVLTLKERPFIDSARVSGASKTRIMFRHIAPNILPLAVLYMTFYVSGAILAEASLSFIGLGDPRTMSWGMMLNYVQHANALTAWWWLMPPGISITLICLSFFLLGRAFDEIVNPRLRRR